MFECVMVEKRHGEYHRIPDSEIEDWEEVLEELEGEPEFIELLQGWLPYTHAYRLPSGAVYLVALGPEN